MQSDAVSAPRSSRPWYATDSGRAGVALSVVTVVVLVVGVAVIHGARPDDTSKPTELSATGPEPITPAPKTPEVDEGPIVVYGAPPTPTPLPAPNDASSESPQTSTAERSLPEASERR